MTQESCPGIGASVKKEGDPERLPALMMDRFTMEPLKGGKLCVGDMLH